MFFGWFRWLYLFVKSLGFYVGVFAVCYYWPLFVQSIVAPPANAQTHFIAVVMLAPLGFLALGCSQGLISAVAHALVLLAAIGVAWLLAPKDQPIADTTALVRAWLPVLVGTYGVGVLVGFWRQLARFAEEPEA